MGGILRLMNAGRVLMCARFRKFAPGDQEDESRIKVRSTSDRLDWLFRSLIEFPCSIQLTHGDYLLSFRT